MSATTMITSTGWRVQTIVLNGRPLIRINKDGFHVRDVTTIDEVKAELGEDYTLLRDERP